MADTADADVEDLPTHSNIPPGQGPTSLPSTSSLPDLSSAAGGAGKEKKKKKASLLKGIFRKFLLCKIDSCDCRQNNMLEQLNLEDVFILSFDFQKLGTGLAMKKKGVGNLVQKWQQIQEEVATKQKD